MDLNVRAKTIKPLRSKREILSDPGFGNEFLNRNSKIWNTKGKINWTLKLKTSVIQMTVLWNEKANHRLENNLQNISDKRIISGITRIDKEL